MENTRIYWNIVVVCIAISAFASFMLESKFEKNNPKLKPFTWGYYIGMMGALSGSSLAIQQFILASKTYGSTSSQHALLGIALFAVATSHFFMIKRYRLAWVIGIILQFNPISWFINGIYLKNRCFI